MLFTPKMLCILEDHKTGVGAIIWAEEKSVSIEKVTFSCTLNSYMSFVIVLKFIHLWFSYTYTALVTKLTTGSLLCFKMKGKSNYFSSYDSVST